MPQISTFPCMELLLFITVYKMGPKAPRGQYPRGRAPAYGEKFGGSHKNFGAPLKKPRGVQSDPGGKSDLLPGNRQLRPGEAGKNGGGACRCRADVCPFRTAFFHRGQPRREKEKPVENSKFSTFSTDFSTRLIHNPTPLWRKDREVT